MTILTLKDLPIENKKVLLRVDFNVPLGENFLISEDSRINAALPSIRFILKQGAALILLSHLGRPRGASNPNFSLKICSERLSKLLGVEVLMAPDCIGEKTEKMKKALMPGQVLMLENVRFHPDETAKEREMTFAKKIAKDCDFYVNDAFGSCHRSQASIVDLPNLFKGKSAMGFLLEKEIEYFKNYIFNPKRPFIAIVGGSKISTKIGVLGSLIKKVDALLIGGAMAYTFLKAKGYELGDSLVEDSHIDTAKDIIKKCEAENVALCLPIDLVFAPKIAEGVACQTLSVGDKVPDGWVGVDIGQKTALLFQDHLKTAATVLWNGPLGVFEIEAFSKGTQKIAEMLSVAKATTIIGGGDSAAAIKQMGLDQKMDHISTGGGAALEFIEKGHLPGIDALINNS